MKRQPEAERRDIRHAHHQSRIVPRDSADSPAGQFVLVLSRSGTDKQSPMSVSSPSVQARVYHASPEGYVSALAGIQRKTLVNGGRTQLVEFKLATGAAIPPTAIRRSRPVIWFRAAWFSRSPGSTMRCARATAGRSQATSSIRREFSMTRSRSRCSPPFAVTTGADLFLPDQLTIPALARCGTTRRRATRSPEQTDWQILPGPSSPKDRGPGIGRQIPAR